MMIAEGCSINLVELQRRLEQVRNFLIAGGISTLSHWASMALLVIAHAPHILSAAVGGIVGAAVNYGLQRKLTFQTSQSHGSALMMYIPSCLASWSSNLGLFWIALNLLNADIWLAQSSATAAVTFLNFFIYKRLVFHEQTA